MKYFLALACLLSVQAQAQSACSSVWIFKANKTCSHASHGIDTTKAVETKVLGEWSPWMGGGKDQLQVCRNVRDGFNGRQMATGGIAELSQPGPIDERKHVDEIRRVTYTYKCELAVTYFAGKVAASPACGQEDRWSYKKGGDAPEGASCLSCETLAGGSPEQMAECLKNSIVNVIQPRAIDLRDEDIAAVKAQVTRLLRINKYRPVANMQTTQQLEPFINFVE